MPAAGVPSITATGYALSNGGLVDWMKLIHLNLLIPWCARRARVSGGRAQQSDCLAGECRKCWPGVAGLVGSCPAGPAGVAGRGSALGFVAQVSQMIQAQAIGERRVHRGLLGVAWWGLVRKMRATGGRADLATVWPLAGEDRFIRRRVRGCRSW
jgi:hypothetical protein